MTAPRMLKLAMVQMLVEGGQLERNLARAAAGIAEAALHGCPIALLPECLDLGWTHPSAGELAAAVPGPTSDRLAQAAAQAGLYVVAGLTERAGERVYNAAVLIDPRGRIVLKHRKINLLDIEQTSYSIGDRLQVAETSLGTVGVNICADNFPDSLALGHALARMGAEVILSPSAWAVPADYDPAAEPYGKLWKDAYADLAPLYDMPIAGCSNVGRITGGPWAGRKCIGCSLAVDARGNVLAKGRYGDDAEELIVVDLPLAPRRVKGTDIGPMLRGRGYRGP